MASKTLPMVVTAALCCVATLVVGSSTADRDYGFAAEAEHLPASLPTASTATVRVRVENLGRHPWSGDEGFALAYHWLLPDGSTVVWDGARTPFVGRVGMGDRVTLDATLTTPHRAGDYLLQWDIVQEGVLWLSERAPGAAVAVPVEVKATHAFAVERVAMPRVLSAGGQRPARVVLRNDGTSSWQAGRGIALAYHWFSSDGRLRVWEGRRTEVGRVVTPGELVEIETTVDAPEVLGRYGLQWDMVEEGVCWFSERDASPEPSISVVVFPPGVMSPMLWSFVVWATAVASALALWRRRSIRWMGLWGASVILWCVIAIFIKQAWVLHAAGTRFSLSGCCLSIAGASLIGVLLCLLPTRLRAWAAWTVTACVTFVLYADLVHVRFFGDLGSVAALRSVTQIGQVGASVRSLLRTVDLWFWADLPAALVLIMSVSRLKARPTGRRGLVAVLSVACGVAAACGAAMVHGERTSLRQVFHTTYLARHIGVLNLHAIDVGGAAVHRLVRRGIDDAGYLELVEYFDERRAQRAGSGELFGAAEGLNLVMIQVESLQEFIVGSRVGGREVTPFLNALTSDSLWFSNVTDQTEEGRSSDAELATQVSLLPPNRGAAAFAHAGNDFTGLASILADRGYSTMSAVPFDGSFWNRQSTHRSWGFDHSLFVDDLDEGEIIGWGLNDRDFLSSAVRHLAGLDRPWSAYLLTLSLHHPFEGFPDHHKVLDVGRWEGTPFGNYLHTMHYFDGALEAFVAELDRAGLADSTVMALWGDHDAGFEWTPEVAAAVGATPDAGGWYLSQEVPLVVHVPGIRSDGAPIEVPAGHVDVAPTLLALLGVDPAPYAFVGRNLLGDPGEGPVIGEYRCWRDARHLYLRRGPTLADGECIELATMEEVDSDECSTGFELARRQVEVSTLVLEHDLQRTLHRSLMKTRP